MKSPVHQSRTFDSRDSVSFQKISSTDVAKDPVSCGFVQDAVQSSYRRLIHTTRQMRRFMAAFRLVQKVSGELGSNDSVLARGALGVTDLANAVLSSAEKQDVLLYVKALVANTQGRKQNHPSKGGALYIYKFALLQALKHLHRSACEKHPSTLDEFLLTETTQTKSLSFLVKKMYLNKLSPF